MENKYEYQSIRDLFLVCAQYVGVSARVGFENRGNYECFVQVRSEFATVLAGYLSRRHIKYEMKKDNVKGVSFTKPDEYIYDLRFKLGQPGAEAIDKTVIQMSRDREALDNLNDLLRIGASYDPEDEKKREQQVNDRKQALNQLKEMITNIEEVRSGDTHRGYFYLYFPADKIDLADELLQKLDIYAEQHVSHLDGKETMVLRYPSTMIPGYFLQVYGELLDALNARKAKGDFEQGTEEIDDKTALEQIKKLIHEIDRLPREQELANPGKLFYCFKFDESALDKAQKLLLQLGVPTEKVKNGNGPAFLLYSVNYDEMPDNVVNMIIDIQEAKRQQRAKQNALAKLEKMVTAVKRAKYDDIDERYYYFYFPLNNLDAAKQLMHECVGTAPEVHVSHAGGIEATVLRYKIDRESDFMDSIEELKRVLNNAVNLRQMGRENGGHIEI